MIALIVMNLNNEIMIVTFDFGIFPTSLFVASEMNFDKLKESFAFDTEENGYV